MSDYPDTLPLLISGVGGPDDKLNAPSLSQWAMHISGETEAIAGELGVQPSGSFDSVVERLDDADVQLLAEIGARLDGDDALASSVTAIGGLVSDVNDALTAEVTRAIGAEGALAGRVGVLEDVNVVTLDTAQTITGQKTFEASAIGTTPLIAKGLASQTADLQQWRNSTGASMASVTATGAMWAGAYNTSGGLNATGLSSFGDSASSGDHNRGISLKAGSSTDWRMWATNAAYLKIGGSGGQSFWEAKWHTTGSIPANLFKSASDTAGQTVVAVKGAASQTADLQQWQSSAGTVLAYLDSAGRFNGPSFTVTADANVGGNLNAVSIYASNNVQASGYAHFLNNVGVGTSATGSQRLLILSSGAAVPVVAVKGAASQTADLTQWVDSTGAVSASLNLFALSGMSSLGPTLDLSRGGTGYGQLKANTIISSANNNTGITLGNGSVRAFGSSLTVDNGTTVTPASTSGVAVVAKGLASQTADLQQWQDSAGSVLFGVDSAGRPRWASTKTALSYGSIPGVGNGLTVTDPSATGANHFYVEGSIKAAKIYGSNAFTGPYLDVFANPILAVGQTASQTVFAVKGAASQSGTLQEWQDSAGNWYARVNSDNSWEIGQGAQTWGSRLSVIGRSVFPALYGKNEVVNNTGGLSYGDHSLYPFSHQFLGASNAPSNAKTIVTLTQSGRAVETPSVLRGAASQTADLQQWQDSTGAVISKVASGGRIRSNASVPQNAGGAFEAANPSPGDVNSVHNFAGYAADGTTLTSKITVGGRFAGAQFLALDGSVGFSMVSGSRIDITGNVWLFSAGAGVLWKAPNGTTTKNVSLADDGTFNMNVNPLAPSWVAEGIGVGVKSPGGAQRSVLYTNGRLHLNMNNPNGYPGWGALEPLLVEHDGAFVFPETGVTGSLIRGKVGANDVFAVAKTGATSHNLTNAAAIGLVVRGAASQTANLQEWHNSTGAVQAQVNPGGAITGAQFYASGVNSSSRGFYVHDTNAGVDGDNTRTTVKNWYKVELRTVGGGNYLTYDDTGLAAWRQKASQTADMMQWQDSAGAVLAKVTSAGLLYEGATAVNAAAIPRIYSHDGTSYSMATGGRIFIGPEDPSADGFTLTAADLWINAA